MHRTTIDELLARVGSRVIAQDDLLRSSWVVRHNEGALERLFDRLADVCLEQLFLELEFAHAVGEFDDEDYRYETARLITQSRAVGLTPPVSIRELEVSVGLDDVEAADREVFEERPGEGGERRGG